MIYQKYVERESKRVDEGTMGFTDYVTHYEPLKDFINRVSDIANLVSGKVKGIDYLHSGGEVVGAIIVYKVRDYTDD